MGGVERGDDVPSFALFSFQSFPKPGCQASFPRPPIRDRVQIIGTSRLEKAHVYLSDFLKTWPLGFHLAPGAARLQGQLGAQKCRGVDVLVGTAG